MSSTSSGSPVGERVEELRLGVGGGGTAVRQRRGAQAERTEQRGRERVAVAERGQLGQPGRAVLPGGQLERQPRLARAAGPDERDEPVAAEQLARALEIGVAADEARPRGGEVPARGRRRAGRGRCRHLAAQHREVGGLELRRRSGAELLVERPAQLFVRGERLGLAARGRQRAQPQRAEPLVERALRGQLSDLPEVGRRVAEEGRGSEPVHAGGGVHLGEPGHVGRGRAPPERQRLVEPSRRRCGVARAQGRGALAGESLEADRVDVLRRDREPVAAGLLRHERRVAERAAQARDERLQRVLLVARRVAVPHGLRERAGGDGAPRVEREPREQRLEPAAGDLPRRDAVLDDEWSQDRDPHREQGSQRRPPRYRATA